MVTDGDNRFTRKPFADDGRGAPIKKKNRQANESVNSCAIPPSVSGWTGLYLSKSSRETHIHW